MGRRKSGGFEGLLIIIAAIIGLAIKAVQYLWPVLLGAAVLGVAIYFLIKYFDKMIDEFIEISKEGE